MIRLLISYLASAYVAFIMFLISIMFPITTVNVHMGEPVNHQRSTSSIAVDERGEQMRESIVTMCSIDINMALRLSVSAYTHTFTFLQLLM